MEGETAYDVGQQMLTQPLTTLCKMNSALYPRLDIGE